MYKKISIAATVVTLLCVLFCKVLLPYNEYLQKTKTECQRIKHSDIGKIVKFGKYNWTILAKKNGKALLITTEGVSSKPYNKKLQNITWENCSLRHWLNEDFYGEFSQNEKKVICKTHVVNSDSNEDINDEEDELYEDYEKTIVGENDTEDYVFLLSCSEVEKYLPYEADMRINKKEKMENNKWWLRSPSLFSEDCAAYVDPDFDTLVGYSEVDNTELFVRPAMWIDIN